jgi:hypothetical protein
MPVLPLFPLAANEEASKEGGPKCQSGKAGTGRAAEWSRTAHGRSPGIRRRNRPDQRPQMPLHPPPHRRRLGAPPSATYTERVIRGGSEEDLGKTPTFFSRAQVLDQTAGPGGVPSRPRYWPVRRGSATSRTMVQAGAERRASFRARGVDSTGKEGRVGGTKLITPWLHPYSVRENKKSHR